MHGTLRVKWLCNFWVNFSFQSILLYLCLLIDCAGRCWKCDNEKGWDDCNDWTEEQCLGGTSRCTKVQTKQGTVDVFRRACVTTEFCDNICKRPEWTDCKIKCCDNNFCNDGALEWNL